MRTPIGDAWILSRDEPAFHAAVGPADPARLLPSGDAYFLLRGADRELLVRDAARRRAFWTPRVWPGALLVDGEVVGTWRRADETVVVQPWRRLSRATREAVEAEAEALPLPGGRIESSSAGTTTAGEVLDERSSRRARTTVDAAARGMTTWCSLGCCPGTSAGFSLDQSTPRRYVRALTARYTP